MRCMPISEMHAYEMHAYEMYAYEMHAYEMHAYKQWSTDTGRGFEPMGQAGQAFSLGLSCQPAWLAIRPNIV
jgi:hypothetical protein